MFLLLLSFVVLSCGTDLFEWFRSRGGYVHPSLELSTGPDPQWEVRGVFATGEILPNERIIEAPPNLQICGNDTCSLIVKLHTEFEKGESSEWWPYLEVLLDHDLDTIPGSWSPEQQAWLEGAGDQRNWFFSEQVTECSLESSPLLSKIAGLVGARSAGIQELICMIPVYDMFNHRNGRSWNSSPNVTQENGLQLLAYGRISQNDQVFNSFGHFTHEMFWRYGFIEQPAQSWAFTYDDSEFLFAVEDNEIWWGQFIDRAWAEGEPLSPDMLPEFKEVLQLYRNQVVDSAPDPVSRPQDADVLGQKRFDLATRYREAWIEALNFAIIHPDHELHNEL